MKIAENPLAGGTFRSWLQLLAKYPPVEVHYLPRAIYVTFMTLLFTPLRGLQRLLFNSQIHKTPITIPPIFVLGHYRCGGTHFMNVITQDSQWGYLSTTQALVPDLFFLGRPVRNLFSLFLHDKRPMDNLRVTPESPEEPEHALGNQLPLGFYQGFCWPDRLLETVEESVLFNGPNGEIAQRRWGPAYRTLLQACTLANGGKPLIIKNPPDTARVPLLLDLFPDARFIFITRNPYVMFPSIRNFYRAYIRDWQFRDISSEEMDAAILDIYRMILKRYEKDKSLIPPEQLVEMRFENFEKHPLVELERIYQALNLPGFETARPAFSAYLDSQKDYQKNHYTLTPVEVEKIEKAWGESIRRWGYQPDGVVDIGLDAHGQ
ncbi:MAG: sulfotransferase [Fidelibacterota bacterium]